jgi:hypothetical protein
MKTIPGRYVTGTTNFVRKHFVESIAIVAQGDTSIRGELKI